jgi:deoxycytidine triphosphate deaminase
MNANGRRQRQNRYSSWDSIPVGQLSDTHLKAVSAELVKRDLGQVTIEHAYIVLHVGEVAWRISQGMKREQLGADDGIEIEPWETVSIVTDEKVNIPGFVAGRIFPKGRMPSNGLMCESTTIVPGFEGYLFVTITNCGPVNVRLHRGLPFAKAEISRLTSAAERQNGTYENAKKGLPRDDHMFVRTPSSSGTISRTVVLELQERVASLEDLVNQSALRQRRTMAVAVSCTLLVLIAALSRPVIQSIRDLPEAQSRALFVTVCGGLLLAAMLGSFRGVNRVISEWLRSVFTRPKTTKTKSDKEDGAARCAWREELACSRGAQSPPMRVRVVEPS